MAQSICSFEGCERPAKSRGWCQTHYTRWWKYGDPDAVPGSAQNEAGIRWVIANHLPPADSSCVLWPFKVASNGYGNPLYVDGRPIQPHVYATELRDGPCPSGMQACHGPCHTRLCVVHVRWGTRVENQADRVRDRTDNRGQNHPLAKLTADQVREIRRLSTIGIMQKDIAALYRLNKNYVGQIIRREAWAWLK